MEILKAGKHEFWDKNHMLVHCMFNYNCNFTCSYCSNVSRRKKDLNTYLKLEAMQNCITDILSLERESFTFALAGGEPTLYKHLKEFYTLLEQHEKRELISFRMSTNGSTLNKVILPLIEATPHIKKNFLLSIHEEQMNLEKYKELLQNFKYKEYIEVKYLAKPTQLEKALEFKDYCTSLGYRFMLQGIHVGRYFDQEYTEDEIDMLLENDTLNEFYLEYKDGENIIRKNFTRVEYHENQEFVNYNNLYCIAGRNYVNINVDGKVYRCHHDKTGVDFSLYEDSFLNYPNLKKIKKCSADRCFCYAIAFPKWRESTHTTTTLH